MSIMTVTYNVIPNIGSVVNQGQGFRVEATIQNNLPTPLDLKDVSLKVTNVPPNFTPLAEEVRVDTVPAGGSVTVSLGFDTESTVPTGAHTLSFQCEAYVFGREWTVIAAPPTVVKPIGIKDLYPKVTDNQDITVTVHPE